MEKLHTPEPWGISPDVDTHIWNKGGDIQIAACNLDNVNSIANARRIVACVNACRDMDMTVLEMPDYSVKVELDTLDAQIAGRLKAESQRDKLLAALKDVIYCSENFGPAYAGRDARDKAKSLIKRVENA